MMGLFPAEGAVTLVDTITGTEHEAYMSSPRVVSGLGELYLQHGLDVNDVLLVARLAEGRFGITAVPRLEAQEEEEAPSAPVTEDPEPAPAAQAEVSAQDPAEPVDDEGMEAEGQASAVMDDEPEAPAHLPEQTVEAAEENGLEPSEQPLAPAATDTVRKSLDPREAVLEAESALSELESEGWAASRQATLWEAGAPAEQAHAEVPDGDDDDTGEVGSVGAGGEVAAEVTPAPASAPRQGRGPVYTEAEDDDAALAAVALSSRLRRAFTSVGYRIEPLATGVHFLHAEMGRRRYKVLVQLLRSGERLDWAGLLSRRRNSPANYMAVVGDRADLIRLSHPAELARATLWSWEALDRLDELHGSVPVTPLDLESHFARDGLFEQGLKRFEQGVASRVAERGAASEVLTRLARNRAPAVFLLEELAQDVNLSRDVVLRILERFSEAPMHLVARVDSGEFLLRQPVDTALAALAAYAESLRQRLPVGRREVITGLDDDELGSGLLDDVSVHAQPDAASGTVEEEPSEPAEEVVAEADATDELTSEQRTQ
jgi:hypothetical protein